MTPPNERESAEWKAHHRGPAIKGRVAGARRRGEVETLDCETQGKKKEVLEGMHHFIFLVSTKGRDIELWGISSVSADTSSFPPPRVTPRPVATLTCHITGYFDKTVVLNVVLVSWSPLTTKTQACNDGRGTDFPWPQTLSALGAVKTATRQHGQKVNDVHPVWRE